MKVLVSAYACEPGKGSEPGAGWNWVVAAARQHELCVLTRANNRESIEAALEHRDQAIDYSLQFARGLDAPTAERFVSMYVNELTHDYGNEGRTAVLELLRRGEAIGAWPGPVRVDFIG